MIAIVGAAMAPTIAVAVTAWPAAPSVMCRSAANGVSRLAGRNSAVTRPKTPSESETIAPQAGAISALGSAGIDGVCVAGEFGHGSLHSGGLEHIGVTVWSFHARNATMLDRSSKHAPDSSIP